MVSTYQYARSPRSSTFEGLDNFDGYRLGDKYRRNVTGGLFVGAARCSNPSNVGGRYALTEYSRGPSFVSGAVTTHGASFDRYKSSILRLGDFFDIADAEHKLGSGGQYDILSESITNLHSSPARLASTSLKATDCSRTSTSRATSSPQSETESGHRRRRISNPTLYRKWHAASLEAGSNSLLTKLSATPGRCSI